MSNTQTGAKLEEKEIVNEHARRQVLMEDGPFTVDMHTVIGDKSSDGPLSIALCVQIAEEGIKRHVEDS